MSGRWAISWGSLRSNQNSNRPTNKPTMYENVTGPQKLHSHIEVQDTAWRHLLSEHTLGRVRHDVNHIGKYHRTSAGQPTPSNLIGPTPAQLSTSVHPGLTNPSSREINTSIMIVDHFYPSFWDELKRMPFLLFHMFSFLLAFLFRSFLCVWCRPTE